MTIFYQGTDTLYNIHLCPYLRQVIVSREFVLRPGSEKWKS